VTIDERLKRISVTAAHRGDGGSVALVHSEILTGFTPDWLGQKMAG
jgi:hypothetical protein